jgi:hypothetical protein
MRTLRRRRQRADAVIGDVDVHALRAPLDQQLAELLALEADVLQDVVLEIEIVAGLADRLERRLESGRPVAQHRDPITGVERGAGHVLLDRQLALQVARIGALRVEPRENALGLPARQRAAGSADADRLDRHCTLRRGRLDRGDRSAACEQPERQERRRRAPVAP